MCEFLCLWQHSSWQFLKMASTQGRSLWRMVPAQVLPKTTFLGFLTSTGWFSHISLIEDECVLIILLLIDFRLDQSIFSIFFNQKTYRKATIWDPFFYFQSFVIVVRPECRRVSVLCNESICLALHIFCFRKLIFFREPSPSGVRKNGLRAEYHVARLPTVISES